MSEQELNNQEQMPSVPAEQATENPVDTTQSEQAPETSAMPSPEQQDASTTESPKSVVIEQEPSDISYIGDSREREHILICIEHCSGLAVETFRMHTKHICSTNGKW